MKKEQIYFDSYEPSGLEAIMDKQHKVIDYLKSWGSTKMFQILISTHDFVDDPLFTRNNKSSHELYIRGRHLYISTITSTQIYKVLNPVMNKKIWHICVCIGWGMQVILKHGWRVERCIRQQNIAPIILISKQ